MYRSAAGDLGSADDVSDVQIRIAGDGGANADRLVRKLRRKGVGVGCRVDRDGRDPHLAGRADDTNRDLAAICDQQLHAGSIRNSG